MAPTSSSPSGGRAQAEEPVTGRVQRPHENKCYRTLNDLINNHRTGTRDFLFDPDFGITLDGDIIEGFAKTKSEGAAINDATAAQAAEFANWLRNAIVPATGGITCNTRKGIQADLPDLQLTGLTGQRLVDVLLEHVRSAS